MLGSPVAGTVPVYDSFWLATGRLRTSRSGIVAGCASQMGQQNSVKSKLFRKSRPHQPVGPSSICVVAEAWQRMHRAEVRVPMITEVLGANLEVRREGDVGAPIEWPLLKQICTGTCFPR